MANGNGNGNKLLDLPTPGSDSTGNVFFGNPAGNFEDYARNALAGEGISMPTEYQSHIGDFVAKGDPAAQNLQAAQPEEGVWGTIKGATTKFGRGALNILTDYGTRAAGWTPELQRDWGIPAPSTSQSIFAALGRVVDSIAAAGPYGDPTAKQRLAEGPQANIMRLIQPQMQAAQLAQLRAQTGMTQTRMAQLKALQGLDLNTKDPDQQKNNLRILQSVPGGMAQAMAYGQATGQIPKTTDVGELYDAAKAAADAGDFDKADAIYGVLQARAVKFQPPGMQMEDVATGAKSIVPYTAVGGLSPPPWAAAAAAARGAPAPAPGAPTPGAAAGPVSPYRTAPQPAVPAAPSATAPTPGPGPAPKGEGIPPIAEKQALEVAGKNIPLLVGGATEFANLKRAYDPKQLEIWSRLAGKIGSLESTVGLLSPEEQKQLQAFYDFRAQLNQSFTESLRPLLGRISQYDIPLAKAYEPNPEMSPLEVDSAMRAMEKNLARKLVVNRAILDRAPMEMIANPRRYLGKMGAGHFGIPSNFQELP